MDEYRSTKSELALSDITSQFVFEVAHMLAA